MLCAVFDFVLRSILLIGLLVYMSRKIKKSKISIFRESSKNNDPRIGGLFLWIDKGTRNQ